MTGVQTCALPIFTAFLAFYEPRVRRLTYSLAGHPPPLRAASAQSDETTLLELAGGLPLGIDADARFDQAVLDMRHGDTLLLYTDGITEARDPDGQMFGDEGLSHALGQSTRRAVNVIDGLRAALAAHQRGRRPVDDQTAVALHVR